MILGSDEGPQGQQGRRLPEELQGLRGPCEFQESGKSFLEVALHLLRGLL